MTHRYTRFVVMTMAAFLLPACGGSTPNLPPIVPLQAAPQSNDIQPESLSVSIGSLLGWANGHAIPAGFPKNAFGGLGPFYKPLAASPQIAANSASAIAYYFAANPEFDVGFIDASSAQAQYDYTFPIYKAASSDPLVTIVCQQAAACADGGLSIHLPAQATAAGGSNHQMTVLEPSGIEYDFGVVSSTPPYAAGSKLNVQQEAHFALNGVTGGTNYVAPGFDIVGVVPGGLALSVGQIYTSELAAGIIPHAIALSFPCSTGTGVFPASQSTGTCANGQGMPLGSQVWWSLSDAQTNALSTSRDMKTVLIALHHYGGFFTDSGAGTSNINGQGGGMSARLENQEQYWIYGKGVDPALNYAANASGWNHIVASSVNRYLLAASGSSINLLSNLELLAPAGRSGPTPSPSPGTSPTPAPSPSASPRASPSPSSSPTFAPTAPPPPGLWSNGTQIPASYPNTAFGGTGPLYQQLPANPTIDPSSASVISYYFAGNPEAEVGWVDNDSSEAQYDYNFPVYTASNTDPLVTITCTGGSDCADGGVQIHLPALAKQAGGSDHHLAVIQISTGVEYDFWEVSSNPPYANGSQLRASGEAHLTQNGSGDIAPGFTHGGATAGGIALSMGQLYISELQAKVINHALSAVFPCGSNSWVFPASQITGTCANGQGMPLGSRVWWAPTDAQTNAMPIPSDGKTILIALHHYGAYFTDNGGGTVNINGQGGGTGLHLESQEPLWIYGNGKTPLRDYAATSLGWNHVVNASVNRYLLTEDGSLIDPLDNVKLLAPCVTQKTC